MRHPGYTEQVVAVIWISDDGRPDVYDVTDLNAHERYEFATSRPQQTRVEMIYVKERRP